MSKNICETKPNTTRNLVAHKQNGPWRPPFAGRHKFLSFRASLWTETGNDPNTSRVHYTSTRQATTTTQLVHDTKPHNDVILDVTHGCVLAGHSRYICGPGKRRLWLSQLTSHSTAHTAVSDPTTSLSQPLNQVEQFCQHSLGEDKELTRTQCPFFPERRE